MRSKTHLNKSKVLENKTIRMITKACRYQRNVYLRQALKLPSLKEFIQKSAKNFFDKLPNIDNKSLRKIPYYDGSFLVIKIVPNQYFTDKFSATSIPLPRYNPDDAVS
ncbi:hypothetical protein AVEN_144420-1 [Araneus ventricosus]|uniref:Uncharacterized protein n=1 Tax=Araneus ventricosus TaxID=182803 RepID=A0A4Y2R4D5_ARAVE|nr:hypothetical protein AVEN_144420-1 [Araneus ventricosus]